MLSFFAVVVTHWNLNLQGHLMGLKQGNRDSTLPPKFLACWNKQPIYRGHDHNILPPSGACSFPPNAPCHAWVPHPRPVSPSPPPPAPESERKGEGTVMSTADVLENSISTDSPGSEVGHLPPIQQVTYLNLTFSPMGYWGFVQCWNFMWVTMNYTPTYWFRVYCNPNSHSGYNGPPWTAWGRGKVQGAPTSPHFSFPIFFTQSIRYLSLVLTFFLWSIIGLDHSWGWSSDTFLFGSSSRKCL